MKENGEIIDLEPNLQVDEEATFVFCKEKLKVKNP
jgi:hypothetical protein